MIAMGITRKDIEGPKVVESVHRVTDDKSFTDTYIDIQADCDEHHGLSLGSREEYEHFIAQLKKAADHTFKPKEYLEEIVTTPLPC